MAERRRIALPGGKPAVVKSERAERDPFAPVFDETVRRYVPQQQSSGETLERALGIDLSRTTRRDVVLD